MIEVRVSIRADEGWVATRSRDGKVEREVWGEIEFDADILNDALDLVLKAYKGGK